MEFGTNSGKSLAIQIRYICLCGAIFVAIMNYACININRKQQNTIYATRFIQT
ncbi:hypothetical protein HMPREF1580_00952 [Gardnerella vaginalis JCP8070]|nr:hypothetical protein HMPREF1580_00952 [Gardnerella vaginalis JCP8070]